MSLCINLMAKDIGKLTLLGGGKSGYPADPGKAKIETFQNEYECRDYWVDLDCQEFTCLCPKTGQPDFGVIRGRYVPAGRCIETKSLKLYLFSYREARVFNEEAVNRILDDLVKACLPRQMEIVGEFNPRGGIGITVEAKYKKTDKKP